MKAVLAAALAGFFVGTGPAGATFPGRNGMIAFTAKRFGEGRPIWLVDANGSGRRFLGTAPFLDSSQPAVARPAISPDGRWVALQDRSGFVVLAATDGRARIRLGLVGDAAWSPDGKRLAATARDGNLAFADVPSGGIEEIQVAASQPVWSPRGDRVAFFDEAGLAVVDLATKSVRHLAEAEQFRRSPVTWSPNGGRLAYERLGDLYLVEVDGGAIQNLTHSSGTLEFSPAWSPDGLWIAFVRATGAERSDQELVVMSPDGRGMRRLTPNSEPIWAPAWRDDGRRILYGRGDAGLFELDLRSARTRRLVSPFCGHERSFAISVSHGGRTVFASVVRNDSQVFGSTPDGTKTTTLAGSCREDREPAWSPDGHSLAYASGGDIYVSRADGSRTRRLAQGSSAAWAPDGARLVVSDGGDLFVVSTNGRRLIQLTQSLRYDHDPDWSPMGGRIAFTSETSHEQAVWSVRPDGTAKRRVASGLSPSWSPDGRRIAFAAVTSAETIYTTHPDGTDRRVISANQYVDAVDPAWSPDGAAVIYEEWEDVNPLGFELMPSSGGNPRPFSYDSGFGTRGPGGNVADDPYGRLAARSVAFSEAFGAWWSRGRGRGLRCSSTLHAMRVAVAFDHRGVKLRERVMRELRTLGHELLDLGADAPEPRIDYPDKARELGEAVLSGDAERGVLVCGSGVGASVAACKLPGIRAAICHDAYSAHQGVEHDDMNVLCLGSEIVGEELAAELVRTFVNAKFGGGERYERRLRKIEEMERAHA